MTLSFIAPLALAATMAVVWVAKPLDREAFCTKAIAIHHPQGQIVWYLGICCLNDVLDLQRQ